MSVQERDFATYHLDDNVHELAGGLLPEMAQTLGYELGESPDEASLRGFIGHIGPAMWLQDNIELVQEKLGTTESAKAVAADWVEHSGITEPLYRSFASPEVTVPTEFDAAFMTGGVARWMLRRAAHLRNLTEVSEVSVSDVVVAAGTREMKESEHSEVRELAKVFGRLPTEAEFAQTRIVPMLRSSGISARAVAVESGVGDEVMQSVVEEMDDKGSILAIGNAPAGIQVAGQFRVAARKENAGFDADGSRLFVASDAMPVSRYAESAATHQNPYTALGQVARSALILHLNRSGLKG